MYEDIRDLVSGADAVVVGAGSGLSTSAGYTYSGERFRKYFSDFSRKYGFDNMYIGGFTPFENMEEFWAYWSRFIWINRYAPIPNDTYDLLLKLVQDKDYFVLTTNVDHCFQRSGFDKQRLFYTQGDYGLLQSMDPKGVTKHKTYDNEQIIRQMVEAQGYEIAEDGELLLPEGVVPPMRIPFVLVPNCPDDGELMTTNLRVDMKFVEDEGWHQANDRYGDFIRRHEGMNVVYLELGVGANTPVIIKYPFWQMTDRNPNAHYVCINKGETGAPREIRKRSICVDADIRQVLKELVK